MFYLNNKSKIKKTSPLQFKCNNYKYINRKNTWWKVLTISLC